MRVRMRVGVRMPSCFGLDHDELCLVNPFQPAEFGCKVLQGFSRATQGDQFHAQVMVQMDVHRRYDAIRMSMLDIDHLVRQFGPVVVVNQRETGCHLDRGGLPRGRGQFFPKQLPDRFTTGGELPRRAEAVELL